MKKVSMIIMILVAVSFVPLNFAFSAGEKTAKGRIEVGGDFGFDRSSVSYDGLDITSTTISVMPRIGYFVIPKLAIEPKLMIVNTSESSDPEIFENYSATHLGAVLNVAYHFEGKGESKYVPFIFGGFGFVSHSGDVGEADEMTMILPDLGGGIKIFVTNDALIRGELFYTRSSNAGGVKDADGSDFGLRAGVSIFVK
jgi:hypothetical protein